MALAGALVERYGPELLGYQQAILHNEDAAQEAFQALCEDMIHALPSFRGDASFRTWLYVIARRRALRPNLPPTGIPLSRSPEVDELVAKTRSATAPYLKTGLKNRVRALQSQLTEEERTLLILRIDRQMAWDDIAAIVGGGTSSDSARIRKRFQRTKAKLRKLAEEAGLLGEVGE